VGLLRDLAGLDQDFLAAHAGGLLDGGHEHLSWAVRGAMRRPPIRAREPLRVGNREAPPVLTPPPLGERRPSRNRKRPSVPCCGPASGRVHAIPPAYLRMPSWSIRTLYRPWSAVLR
jgi:hypothetical protein